MTEGNAWMGAAFTLDSSVGPKKMKAARCKSSYATTGGENQNARMNPEDTKREAATQHNPKEKSELSEKTMTTTTREHAFKFDAIKMA